MKRSSLLLFILMVITISGCKTSSDWTMKEPPVKSRWAEAVTPENVWQEYPRPQMVRPNWKNLNGLWDYAVTSVGASFPDSADGQILVPFPIESALSGVMRRIQPDQQILYRRPLQINAKLKSRRILLHFEAVDWKMEAWIDGNSVGTHQGGYDPFTFDITDHIKAGEKHELMVSAWDPTTDGYSPLGKQFLNPHGIWYTPSSGIWQTVWIEMVPETYIESYYVVPDIDASKASITVNVKNIDRGVGVEVDVVADNKLVGTFEGMAGEPFTLDIPEARLWQPGDPFLYDLHIRVKDGNQKLDEISGYFGMRKISIGKDEQGTTRILLNNRFVFQNGPLDQGFWPDGLNTPPSDEAMLYDIEMTMKMGFNMLRKHVKVEPRRFYYHTDRLGMLVWQDMPSMFYGVFKEGQSEDEVMTIKTNFANELRELVYDHYNHPSIVMWVPFNEGWGQHDTEQVVNMVYQMDQSRLVNNASGWTDKGVGDVLDIHHYPDPIAPAQEENRAIVLGEFGGLGLYVPGHVWQEENWGYEKMQSVEDLLVKYENFYQEVFRLRDEAGLSAVVYTQTTDVETETNGLMTYDRDSVKMGVEAIARAHAGKIPPRMANGVRQFIDRMDAALVSTSENASIHYTTDGSEPNRFSAVYSSPLEITGNTTVKARSYWPDGDSSRTASFQFEKVVPRAASAVGSNLSQGLSVKLYEGEWDMLPDFNALSPVRRGIARMINLDFSPHSQMFGLVFEGYLRAPETGVYVISLSSDDGGRIYLGDEALIDYDGIHGANEKQAAVALEAGMHPIRLIYFQRAGGLGLKVMWESSDMEKQEIGSAYWYR